MPRRRPGLRLVAPQAPRRERQQTALVHLPEGVPEGASCCVVFAVDDLPDFGVREADACVIWEDAPLRNYDFALVVSGGESYVGRLHFAPGGRVRLELSDGGVCYFAPHEIEKAGRVMHVERDRKIVKRFPLKKGGE